MDDVLAYYAAITTAVFLGLTLVVCIFLDLRAHAEERKQLNRLLITALFRMSKDQIKTLEDQTRHVDALGVALLRALRQGNAAPALLAEVQREMALSRGLPPHAEAPPGEPEDPQPKE